MTRSHSAYCLLAWRVHDAGQGQQAKTILDIGEGEFDELTHFTWRQFSYMFSRNRSTCGVRPYIRAGCNPDAASWVARWVEWWIDAATGLPIPERSGVIRWFVRDGDNIRWGDSPAELRRDYPDAGDPLSFTFIGATLEVVHPVASAGMGLGLSDCANRTDARVGEGEFGEDGDTHSSTPCVSRGLGVSAQSGTASAIRRRAIAAYFSDISHPMKLRPVWTQATPVVPEPQNGSNTVDHWNIRLVKAKIRGNRPDWRRDVDPQVVPLRPPVMAIDGLLAHLVTVANRAG